MNSDDIKLLPIRNIYQVHRYNGLGEILKKDDSIRGKEPENNHEARPISHDKKYRFDLDTVQTIEYFAKSSAVEKPRYCVFLHDKMDGILPAYQLKDMLGSSSLMLTRALLGDSSINCIKRRKILNTCLQHEIIVKKRFLSTDNFSQLIKWGVSLLFSFLTFLVTVLTSTVGNQPLLLKYPFFRILPVLCFIIFSLLAAFLSFSRVRECQIEMLNQLKVAVKGMPDSDFFAFLNNFVADDFTIPDLYKNIENTNIICPLSIYSPREQAVLLRYLHTNTRCEFWWIFEELDPYGDLSILTQPSKYDSRFYRLLPLTFVEKRKLATEFGRNIHDPGLKPFGVDYIASKLLCDILLPDRETEESLYRRLDRFVNQYQNQYPFNIPRVIRLVAELSVTFHVDYSVTQHWESIFSYATKDFLTTIDLKLSTELVSGVNSKTVKIKLLRQLKNLVSLIINAFEFSLYQIIKADYGPKPMTTDVQLYLVKTMRCQGDKGEDRCLALAECLYYQMKNYLSNPIAFNSDEWLNIVEEALLLFQKQKFGWFSASLNHLLIELCEKNPSESLKELLRKKVIQDSAKESLFFYNQERHFSEKERLNVVEDHVRLAMLLQINPSEEHKKNLVVPSWSNLLNLTDEQCKHYVMALNSSNERIIPQYYQVLYEMFTIRACQSNTVFCRHLFPPVDLSFYDSIKSLLDIVLTLGDGRDCQAYEGCKVLFQIVSEFESNCKVSEELTSKCLYYMALWEALGFSVGSFAASLVFQEAQLSVWDSNERKKMGDSEIRIDMGNPVARLVYLTYVQTREGSFHSRQAIELTDILTSYLYPSLPILGYILNLCMYSLPDQCEKNLNAYFLAKNPVFELCPATGGISSNDLIQYIIDVIACSILNKEAKEKYFYVLLDDYEDYFGKRKDGPVIKEFLSRYVRNQPTELYKDSTPEHILSEALNLCSSSDIIYLLYSKLYDVNNEVSVYCDRVADHLLKTSLGGGVLLLIRSWVDVASVSTNPRHYYDVANKLYSFICQETICYVSGAKQSLMEEKRIRSFYGFLEVLSDKVTNRQKPYFRNFSNAAIAEIESLLSELEQRIMMVTLFDIVYSKQWTSLPLLTCICYILEHAMQNRVCNSMYDSLCSQKERDNWLYSNAYTLRPIVDTIEGSAISEEFIDLLNLAIRKGEQDLTRQVHMIVENHITSIVNTVFDKVERRQKILDLIEIVRKSYNTVEL